MRTHPLSLAVPLAVALGAPAAPLAAQALPVPEALKAEGIPAIPASLAAEVRPYTESRSASLADWHPERREILVSTRFGSVPQIHRVAMPGGARTQLTFFDEPVGAATYDPAGGRYFLFLKDQGGNEFSQIFRYDLADGRVTLLTDGRRSQNGGIVWSRDGRRIAYAGTGRNGADRDLYVMDPTDPASGRIVMQVTGGGWGALDWSLDDRRLVVGEYVSINESYLWLLDVASGERVPLTPRDSGSVPVSHGGAQFAGDGRGLWITTDADAEFLRLAYMDLATRRVTPVTTDIPWDVEAFAVSPRGDRVAFVVNEAGIGRLYLMDAATRRYAPVAGIPVGVLGGLAWHRNNTDLGFTVTSARTPADVFSLDAATGRVERWTESELGGLVASELPEPTLVRWPSFDGREITGFLYRPPARFTGRRPVLINIHGGPEAQSRPTFLGRGNYWLNEAGVAVLFPNVRGSTGFGKTFVQLDNGMKREDSVRDIGALLDWIARQPDLDPSRVMVTGGSYGGYMTLAVATNYPDRICCALDVVGISHFTTFLQNTEAYRRDLRRAEYGDERVPAMAAFFDSIAPLNNAHRIRRPLFVVQGANDPRVPLSEADQIVARVRQNGGNVWYLVGANEGHGFRRKENVDYQFYATVLFVRQHLLGESAPAPAR